MQNRMRELEDRIERVMESVMSLATIQPNSKFLRKNPQYSRKFHLVRNTRLVSIVKCKSIRAGVGSSDLLFISLLINLYIFG